MVKYLACLFLSLLPLPLIAGKWDGNNFTKFSMDVNHPKCPFPIPFEMKLIIKNETSSLISHTYIIDRNQSGGQVRGEEEIKLALLESKDLSHTFNDNQQIPVLEIRVLRENKWFCPT